MQYRLKKDNHWKLAILFSAILSLMGLLTQNTVTLNYDILLLLPVWILTFSFLLIAWYLNSFLTNLYFINFRRRNLINKFIIIIISNILLLFIFILLGIFISGSLHFEREHNFLYLFVRGSLSIAIIYLVQYSINLNARNQLILLQNQMLKTENIRVQFELLKHQISPHFLFNSLSSLRSMIRNSNINAENFVIKLSDIYRLLLANKEIDKISLKEELEFVEDYSFLLFARYENMLQIEFNISQNILHYKIPTFTLQLLLENCVKHNIISRERPLHIKIYDSGIKSISIENNLQRRINSGEESGIGLPNLIKRYELLGVSGGVQIFYDEFIYRVKIKLLDE